MQQFDTFMIQTVYNTGTGTIGRGHWDAYVGTWDLRTREEGRGDVWDARTRGPGSRERGDDKYRGRGR